MRKKREYIDGAAYHVTSRTNDKIRVFECKLGKTVMRMVLKDAKAFRFKLMNFCIMPTHIHLLIIPGPGGNLSQIMHWVKTHSSKRWNELHGSTGHLWGNRFFARPVTDLRGYLSVMDYIDQNPVKAKLSSCIGEWEACGAYHIQENIKELVDYDNFTQSLYTRQKLLTADALHSSPGPIGSG
jgi:putative transposase